jgi:hypothetical protein
MVLFAESFRIIEIVPDCTASLKVALTAVETATPVAPEAGDWAVIVGCVVSAAPAVVKLQFVEVIVLPLRSLTPLRVMVYVVDADNAELGVNVAVLLVLS